METTTTRIPVHSLTDLITNSSTTIYTYSDRSEGALREMINEVLSVLRTGKRCEDLFHLTITLDDNGSYSDYLSELDEDDEESLPEELRTKDYHKRDQAVSKIVKSVIAGEMEKPQWMKALEDREDGDGFRPSTTLNIVPKLPEYEKLARLIKDFLYSTDQEPSSG